MQQAGLEEYTLHEDLPACDEIVWEFYAHLDSDNGRPACIYYY